MKLTEDVLLVLQNAAKINQHLVVPVGNKINSITEKRNRLMVCTLTEEFPVEFALHDLSGFLRQLTLFDDPSVDFKEDKMIITDDEGSRSSYQYSNKEDLIYLQDDIVLDDFVAEFDLSLSALDKVIRACAANKVEDVLFSADGSNVYIKAMDKENPTRVYSVKLGETDKVFEYYLKHEKKNKLTIPLLDYKVKLSKRGIIYLCGKINDIKVEYYVAAERDFKC